MRDQDNSDLAPRRPVWRPKRSTATESNQDEKWNQDENPTRSGGPVLTVDERYELMKARKREMDEAKARAEAEAAEKERNEKPPLPGGDDDEDEQKMLERFRNDRYSVKLLRQQDDAWGGRGGDAGALG